MCERQLGFIIDREKNEFKVTGPDWQLPPKPLRWPTAEEFRAAAAREPDPREALKELRRQVPLAGSKTWGIIIRAAS